MRTLVEALKEHTGCEHVLEQVTQSQIQHVSGADNSACFVFMPLWGDAEVSAEAGSRNFHDAARWLMKIEGHTRHAMHITDEEYAGFVAE